jgi:hypothetical protein
MTIFLNIHHFEKCFKWILQDLKNKAMTICSALLLLVNLVKNRFASAVSEHWKQWEIENCKGCICEMCIVTRLVTVDGVLDCQLDLLYPDTITVTDYHNVLPLQHSRGTQHKAGNGSSACVPIQRSSGIPCHQFTTASVSILDQPLSDFMGLGFIAWDPTP